MEIGIGILSAIWIFTLFMGVIILRDAALDNDRLHCKVRDLLERIDELEKALEKERKKHSAVPALSMLYHSGILASVAKGEMEKLKCKRMAKSE